jgi:hypothetical protein
LQQKRRILMNHMCIITGRSSNIFFSGHLFLGFLFYELTEYHDYAVYSPNFFLS